MRKLTPPPMNRTTLLNYASALALLLTVVLLFTPFWHFGEGADAQGVSINSYVWFPGDNKAVENYMADALGEKQDINAIIIAPIFLLALGAVGTVLCLVKPQSNMVGVFPLATGIIGIWGFASCPALRLGGHWGLMLALCIAAALMGVLSLAGLIQKWKEE